VPPLAENSDDCGGDDNKEGDLDDQPTIKGDGANNKGDDNKTTEKVKKPKKASETGGGKKKGKK